MIVVGSLGKLMSNAFSWQRIEKVVRNAKVPVLVAWEKELKGAKFPGSRKRAQETDVLNAFKRLTCFRL